jgi:hypothetical protein
MDIEQKFFGALEARPTVGWNNLQQIVRWSCVLDGQIWARLLMAQLNDCEGKEIIDACADAIAQEPSWAILIHELVRNVPATEKTATVFSRVVAQKAPTHPAAAYDSKIIKIACAFDGPLTDDIIVIRTPLAASFSLDAPVLLVSIENPLEVFGEARLVAIMPGRLHIARNIDHPLQSVKSVIIDPCWILQSN